MEATVVPHRKQQLASKDSTGTNFWEQQRDWQQPVNFQNGVVMGGTKVCWDNRYLQIVANSRSYDRLSNPPLEI